MLESAPMQTHKEPGASALGDLGWRVMGLLNLYRLLIPPVLYAIHLYTAPQPSVGGVHPRLFLACCVLYFIAGIVLVMAQRLPRLPHRLLLAAHCLTDAISISLILYSSGAWRAASASCWSCRWAPRRCLPRGA